MRSGSDVTLEGTWTAAVPPPGSSALSVTTAPRRRLGRQLPAPSADPLSAGARAGDESFDIPRRRHDQTDEVAGHAELVALGHCQLRTTMDIYGNVIPAPAREAAGRMGAVLPSGYGCTIRWIVADEPVFGPTASTSPGW
jgi:hypothetical protein